MLPLEIGSEKHPTSSKFIAVYQSKSMANYSKTKENDCESVGRHGESDIYGKVFLKLWLIINRTLSFCFVLGALFGVITC